MLLSQVIPNPVPGHKPQGCMNINCTAGRTGRALAGAIALAAALG